MAIPSFDLLQKLMDKMFETTGTVEKWLSEITEEVFSTVDVVDGKDKSFRSKSPIINHATNIKIKNLKKQTLLYKATSYYTAQLCVIYQLERN